jgi:hypothetical protein
MLSVPGRFRSSFPARVRNHLPVKRVDDFVQSLRLPGGVSRRKRSRWNFALLTVAGVARWSTIPRGAAASTQATNPSARHLRQLIDEPA